MNGRFSTRALLLGVSVGAITLASCDTGDGKTLQPYDPDDYPSQTAPPTSMTDGDSGVGAFDDPDGLGGSRPLLTSPGAEAGDAGPTGGFQVFAPWLDGGEIDARHTCDGDDVAPAISWGSVPAGTVEIAIAMVDHSAVSEGAPFVHWVIAGLDPADITLIEGDVPPQSEQALNYFGDVGYGGPCPPPGDAPHLYGLTAYALNTPLEVADGDIADDFLDAIARVSIGSADLNGTYQR